MRESHRYLALTALICLLSSSAQAQTSDRGWIDFNYMYSTPTQDAQVFTRPFSLFREIASLTSEYPDLPAVSGTLFGGGGRIIGGLGAGVQFTQVKYEYNVGLSVRIPHPTIANRFATDANVTDPSEPLGRTDRALDLSVSYQLPTPDNWRVRVFGGPTLFDVKQDFVGLIEYSQVFNAVGGNVVRIDSYNTTTVDKSLWGVHLGGDVSFFFSRHFGAGGAVRFNNATFNVERQPLTGDEVKIKLGSTMVGGGLRIRF